MGSVQDYQDMIRSDRNDAISSVVGISPDDDPQKAARAAELGDATGLPSEEIYQNVDEFEQQHKALLNSDLIATNPHLQDQLNSHPLAAKISQDDIANLDELHQSLDSVPKDSSLYSWLKQEHDLFHGKDWRALGTTLLNTVTAMATPPKAVEEAFQGWGQTQFQRPNDLEFAFSHPEAAAVLGGVSMGIEAVPRAINAMMLMGHENLSSLIGERPATEIFGGLEYLMSRGDIGFTGRGAGLDIEKRGPLQAAFRTAAEENKLPVPDAEAFEKADAAPTPKDRLPIVRDHIDRIADMATALEIADPWTSVGKEPPYGLHPLIDKAKDIQAKEDIKSFNDAFQKAVATATRERSPTIFSNGLRTRLGDRQIGIDPEAIDRLYGDKTPEADDNLLGWDPDLQSKLDTAKLTGDRVWVNMADYFGHTDPEVHKQLLDDIAVRSDSPTKNDMKIEAEPKEAINDPLAQAKGSAGLEPLAMAGDRKIRLFEKPVDPNKPVQPWNVGMHSVDMFDENGTKVGRITLSEQKDGKQLYIEMIQAGDKAHKFYQPNFLGPSLIMDIKRQLKAMYPKAESITGHRVTGAREKAGDQATLGKQAMPEVKLQLTDDPQGLRDLLEPYWEPISANAQVLRVPEEGWTPMEQAIRDAVESERQRIAPSAEGEVVHAIDYPKVGGRAGGLFSPSTAKMFVSLERAARGPSAEAQLGSLRHEAIHYLYREGFISDAEWSTLTKAAQDEDWRGRFKIDQRYRNFSEEIRNEEAIAEAYRDWKLSEGITHRNLAPIFQKIADFMDRVRRRISEALGRELSWEDIFKEIDEGRVGRRELEEPERGEEPLAMADYQKAANDNYLTPEEREIVEDHLQAMRSGKAAMEKMTEKDVEEWGKITQKILENEGKPQPTDLEFERWKKQFSEKIGKPPGEEPLAMADTGDDFGIYDKGKALGVTDLHMRRMEKLMAQQNKENYEWSKRKAEARNARMTRAEIKFRRTELRDEVRESVNQRPDIASDQFMSKYGVKFHPDYLSEDQKARLPKDYIQKKDGVNPDDLAPYFGYTSGDALVERLGMLTEDRRRSGMSPRDYLNRLVDVETDRRLNQEFAGQGARDLEDAKDQALSESGMRQVHEETMLYGQKAGVAPKFTLDGVKAMTRKAFDDLPVGSISRDRLMQTALRIGKKIEEAGAAGKWDTAYQLSQQRQYALLMAKYAGEYQKERAALDRTAKTMSKREPTGIRAEFVNWVHDLLVKTGYGIGRSMQDLQENIARKTSQTLADFVDEKRAEYRDPDSVPVADFLLDPNFKMNVDDMKYSEFKDFKTSIDALVKAGRDENKIYIGGEARDRIQFRDQARADLQSFGYKPSKSEPGRIGKWPKALFYGITNMETLFNRISRGDIRKPLNQLIMKLAEASNSEATLQREIAKLWAALPDIGDLSKLVDSPITDPRTRGTPQFGPDGSGTWEGFTRGNVIKMLLNAGNEGNWKVLAKGYGADPVALFHWLEKNVTKEDLQFAEKMGDIYKKLIGQYDDVRERMTGTTVQKIKLKPLEFNLKDGTTYKTDGWYHPLEADPIRRSVWVQDDAGQWSQIAQGKRDLIGDENYQFSLADGFTKKRTGAIYPLNLDMSVTPHTVDQIIHGIHFKEVVKETEKLFSDPLFFEDVAKYYGKNYADGLVPYLRAVAGYKGLPGKNLAMARQASEFMRQNVASTYIAFNLGTVAKHFSSAWVFSMRGVGSRNYLEAFRELNLQAPSVSKASRDWVDQTFEEVSRREQNWRDTIEGQQRELTGEGNLRQRIMQTGASWVATSDLISARATALAAYKKAKAEGMSEGDSVAMGNRAVRLQHGSTAQTNLPPIVRGSGGLLEPWMTTFYGFFGTAMQRRIETLHKMSDAWDLGVNQREWGKAGKNARSALGDFMTYAFWPTLIEEVVNGVGTDDHRTWLSRIFSAASMGLASTIPYIRDITRAASTGQDPGAGLFTSLLADQNKIIRDVLHPEKALSRQHAAKTVGDFLTGVGEATGYVPKPIANIARYGTGLAVGTERPKGPLDVARGLFKGTAKERVER